MASSVLNCRRDLAQRLLFPFWGSTVVLVFDYRSSMCMRSTHQQARDTARVADHLLQVVQRGFSKTTSEIEGDNRNSLAPNLKYQDTRIERIERSSRGISALFESPHWLVRFWRNVHFCGACAQLRMSRTGTPQKKDCSESEK